MIERVIDDYRRIKHIAPVWDLLPFDDVFYLVETEDQEDIGVMFFHPCDEPGLLMHVELGNKCRGKRATETYQNAFNWIFNNTDTTILHGRIPAKNKSARFMAVHVGGKFTEIDVDGLRCYSVEKSDFQKRVI